MAAGLAGGRRGAEWGVLVGVILGVVGGKAVQGLPALAIFLATGVASAALTGLAGALAPPPPVRRRMAPLHPSPLA